MPNYLKYQKSIAKEFKAHELRVRHLIDDANWAEEGRYKEIILMNYLKRILPKNLSVGTGFVRNKNRITKQIDLIIYENNIPPIFSEGDFIVTTPENVIGIIEVKSSIEPSKLLEIVDKANENGLIISNGRDISIFNGVFAYSEVKRKDQAYQSYMKKFFDNKIVQRDHFNEILPKNLKVYVNNICLGDRRFIKLWPFKEEYDEFFAEYSFYKLPSGLGISYFLSNLQEFILRRQLGNYSDPLESHYKDVYYPLPEGKEVHKMYFEKFKVL